MRVVGSEDAHHVGEVLLVQGDGLVEASRRLVSEAEVVAAGHGVGVVGSEVGFVEGQCASEVGDGNVRLSVLVEVGTGEVAQPGHRLGDVVIPSIVVGVVVEDGAEVGEQRSPAGPVLRVAVDVSPGQGVTGSVVERAGG